jgi:hypothetical protein
MGHNVRIVAKSLNEEKTAHLLSLMFAEPMMASQSSMIINLAWT